MKKNQTVGQLVLENPQVIGPLSKLGIDFCCGGEMTLEDAAEELGLEPEKLIEKLKQVEKKERGEIEDALNLDTPALMDYIVEFHHKREIDFLEEIDPLLQKILRVHYKNHGKELSEIYGIFTKIKGALIPHFYQEEQMDFPQFLEGKDMDTEALVQEHQEVGALIDGLEERTLGFTPPQDACTSYRLAFEKLAQLAQDIHKHVFLENQVLFKRSTK